MCDWVALAALTHAHLHAQSSVPVCLLPCARSLVALAKPLQRAIGWNNQLMKEMCRVWWWSSRLAAAEKEEQQKMAGVSALLSGGGAVGEERLCLCPPLTCCAAACLPALLTAMHLLAACLPALLQPIDGFPQVAWGPSSLYYPEHIQKTSMRSAACSPTLMAFPPPDCAGLSSPSDP